MFKTVTVNRLWDTSQLLEGSLVVEGSCKVWLLLGYLSGFYQSPYRVLQEYG